MASILRDKRRHGLRRIAPAGRVLAALLLAGCASVASEALRDPYGVTRSAVVDPTIPTPPLTPLLADRVRLVTWNAPSADMTPGASHTFPYPIWTTVDGELKEFCQGYTAAQRPGPQPLQRRLEQLLGLHPGDGAGRQLITIEADRAQIIRPCPDPATDTAACRALFDRKSLAAALDKDPAADRFLLEQMLLSYDLPDGYPFTRRGFTYDWSPEARGGNFGLSEYVTRGAATVTIVAPPQTPGEYCGAGK